MLPVPRHLVILPGDFIKDVATEATRRGRMSDPTPTLDLSPGKPRMRVGVERKESFLLCSIFDFTP